MSDSSQSNSRTVSQSSESLSSASTPSNSSSSTSRTTPAVQQQQQQPRTSRSRSSQTQHGRPHGLENQPRAQQQASSSSGATERGPPSHSRGARGRGRPQLRCGSGSGRYPSQHAQGPRGAPFTSSRGSHATPSGGRGGSRYRDRHAESSSNTRGQQLKNYLISEKGQFYVPSESEKKAARSKDNLAASSSTGLGALIPYDGPDLFSLLPVEIHCRIFSFLADSSLAAMTATSTRFYSICQHFIWKKHLSELCNSLEVQVDETDDGQLRIDLDVLEPTPGFQPLNPSVAITDSSQENGPAPDSKWTSQMAYRFVDNANYRWRIGDYREDVLLPSLSRFNVETEPRVALSKPNRSGGPDPSLLVSTQGGFLYTAAFDSHSTRNCCRFFASEANWHSVNAHAALITSLRTFNSSTSMFPDDDPDSLGDPDSTQFAAIGSITGLVKVFNLSCKQQFSPVPVACFKAHARAVESLDVFGDLLWSGGTDGNLVLNRISTSKFLQSIDLEARIWSVRCDASRVAVGIGGGLDRPTLRIYDLETGKSLQAIKGHAAVYDLQFCNTPLGASYEEGTESNGSGTLLSASYDGMVCQWDLRAKNPCVATFCDPSDEPLYCLQRRGWKLAVGTALYSSVRLWDLRMTGGATFGKNDGRCLRSFFVGKKSGGPIYSLCFDETKLFATPRDSLCMLNFAASE